MAPNIQNVVAQPSPMIRSAKVLVTTNVQVQLNPVTIEAAEPRILAKIQIQIDKIIWIALISLLCNSLAEWQYLIY
jgi:hypothetical protein